MSRFNLGLSPGLRRALAGRAPGEESGKIVLSLKPTAGFHANLLGLSEPQLPELDTELNYAQIQWPKM